MRKLSHQDLLGLTQVVKIDDLWLLPKIELPTLGESLALQKSGLIDHGTSEIARSVLTMGLLDLEREYEAHHEEHGVEPMWMPDLPLHSQAWLRHYLATQCNDVLAIVPSLPHTGLSYMIPEDGLCEEACGIFKLGRLQYIRQLGYLQAPWVAMFEQPMVTPITDSTRYLHSLDVMAIATLIGRNLKLKRKMFNTLRVAALTHDWLTPAGGDSVKLIDPAAFDEDENYGPTLQTLDQHTWRTFKKKHRIDEGLLIATVRGKGLLGEILDVADKLAYVARDINTVLGVILQPNDDNAYVGTRILDEIIHSVPHVCNVWDSVRAVDDRVVFSDASRLIAFLKTRIVLFRELYYHPRARFGEYLISRLLAKRLYESGTLTKEQLLTMTDSELERCFDGVYGRWGVTRALSLKSNVRSFQTQEEATLFKKELETGGNPFTIMEDHRIFNKTGANFLVATPHGPQKLSDAYPGDAKILFEMANMHPSVHVYWLDGNESEIAQALEQLQRQTVSAG